MPSVPQSDFPKHPRNVPRQWRRRAHWPWSDQSRVLCDMPRIAPQTIEILQRQVCLLECLAYGLDRSNAHDYGIAARDGIRHEPTEGRQSVLFHGRLRGHDNGAGPIAIGSRHDALFTKDGTQLGHACQRGLGTRVFVHCHYGVALFGRDGHGTNFRVENAGSLGGRQVCLFDKVKASDFFLFVSIRNP